MDVTYWGAVLGGLLSFVSPCVLPLVPPYLCFLAGVTLDEFTGEDDAGKRARIVGLSAAFVLGFSLVFIALGATASAFGQFVRGLLAYQVSVFGMTFGLLPVIAGLVIALMGLHFLGVFRFGWMDREARVQVKRKPAGPLGALLVGVAFGFGWTPCIGPVLGTILFVAGSEDTVANGALLLAAYSVGMGLPFLAAALFAGPFMRLMRRFRRYQGTVEKTTGALLVLTGFLFITGQLTALSYWLLETFPGFAQIG
ncbi:MAG: cytochrome c biogenesis protein CcdA [Bauldia sp.]|nr:cytochrome c biogenesis protein CcdA [Bauldia sp.]